MYSCNKEPVLDPNDPKNHIHWDDCVEFTGGILSTGALSFNAPSLDDPEVNISIGILNGSDDTFDLLIFGDEYELTLKSSSPESLGYPKLDFYDSGHYIYDPGEIFIDSQSNSLEAKSTVQFILDDGWDSSIIESIRSCASHRLAYRRKINETDSVSVIFRKIN